MKEQALSAQQVQVSIEQLNQVTQQNAAVVEEMSASSQTLNEEAGSLNNMVNQFKLNDQPQGSIPETKTEPLPTINDEISPKTTDEFQGDDWSKF
jgi:methyl-accepting chemotaxis protein